MARGDLDVEALSDALCSSAQLSENMNGIGEGGGGMQVTCFSEDVDDATLNFQVMFFLKQIYVWIGCNSVKFGHLFAAAPTRSDNAVSASCVLGGGSDNSGSSIARHLMLKTGLPIMLACNIPKNSPMLEAAAEKVLVHKLISLGYTKLKPLGSSL